MSLMAKLKNLLRNRNAIFLLAMIAGLTAPWGAPLMKHLVLPALALAMTLSTMEIRNESFARPRLLLLPALLGIVMNYVVLGGVILGLSALMIRDERLWTGFVLLASVPPAVAVIPFSGFLKGNGPLALFGTVGAYLGGLLIMPGIALTLLSSVAFDPLKLMLITLELIVLPLAASRLLIRRGLRERIEPYRGTVVNWSFFVVLYAMIGLNRDLLLTRSLSFLPVVGISLLITPVLGSLIDGICGLFHVPQENRVSLVLLGTLKNQGLASGLALTLFSEAVAVPSVVNTMVMIAYVMWLDFRKRRD
jgi:bile acid:Na+ symporter, BASS family